MIAPVDYAPSQRFGENPTRNLPPSDWIIQAFGNYQPDGHTGVDYPCPIGTQVRAVTGGTVLHVGWMAGTYVDNPWWINPGFAGYVYVVDHGSFIGIYGHCKDASNWVNKGDRVTEGQTLGLSGNTGASTGPHLHFEALPDGYVLNSYMYGRIDPATLFTGSLSYASAESIKPLTPEGDELSAQEVQIIVDAINHAFHRTKTELPGDTTKALLDFKVDAEKTGGQINLGAFLAEYRHNNNRVVETTSEWILPEVVALRELVKQLSVAQGVTIDYEAIAKAVNDDAAKRMQG
jgi:hypothetical protein